MLYFDFDGCCFQLVWLPLNRSFTRSGKVFAFFTGLRASFDLLDFDQLRDLEFVYADWLNFFVALKLFWICLNYLFMISTSILQVKGSFSAFLRGSGNAFISFYSFLNLDWYGDSPLIWEGSSVIGCILSIKSFF